jgi:hypothetical protein
METVYKYRQLWGIAEYNIIEGEFGDSTLHLQDTTCDHYDPKCEIEVVKCDDGDCYQFSKPLNSSAENYSYFHKVEKFWATKEEAYIDAIRVKIENCQNYIAGDERRLSETQEKLAGISDGDVHYLTSAMAKLGADYYVQNSGSCRIIGIISFEDGTTGYLTDSNYASDWADEDGDRIILVEHNNGCKIVSENGDDVFLSKSDSINDENNHKIAKLNKMVENYQRGIERSTARLNNLQDAFDKRDTLTLDELTAIANS